MNVGFQEVLLILFVVLLLFGPKQLPELARGIGRAIREVRRSFREVEESVRQAVEEEEEEKK